MSQRNQVLTTHRGTEAPRIGPSIPEDIREAIVRLGDRLPPGLDLRWFDDVTSTSDVAARLADYGAPEGVIVLADAQSAGRGRHGRTWASPRGAGIYASLVLRPPAAALPLLTIAAGVALADGLHRSTGLAPDLKWPNDVLIAGRKVAGILAEAGTSGDRHHVVLGLGINVTVASYPADVASRATSVEAELGRPVDRGLVLAECLAGLWTRYGELCRGGAAAIVATWRAYGAMSLRRAVTWRHGAEPMRGVVLDIADDGALVVSTSNGIQRIVSGEVQWV